MHTSALKTIISAYSFLFYFSELGATLQFLAAARDLVLRVYAIWLLIVVTLDKLPEYRKCDSLALRVPEFPLHICARVK